MKDIKQILARITIPLTIIQYSYIDSQCIETKIYVFGIRIIKIERRRKR